MAAQPGTRESIRVETSAGGFELPCGGRSRRALACSLVLLMLVTAFGGYARVMAAYRHAIAQAYRFYSYGDAMFLQSRDRMA